MSGSAAPRSPRVISIPAGAPFLETLVELLLRGTLFGRSDPLRPDELADALLFLPTRRAAEVFASIIAARAPQGALMLPRIVLLGDPEPDSAAGSGLGGPAGLPGLPPAIDPLVRQLKLFELVDAWRRAIETGTRPHGDGEPFFVARSRADAFALAGDLAGLIDETIIEAVPLERLGQGMPPTFDPSRHDAYWSLTAKFLEIAAQQWPVILAELGQSDAEHRTRSLLLEQAQRLAQSGTGRPVIVAGSTGSVSATAELMRCVAGLTMGAVVLPGLDTTLDAAAWDAIGAEDAALATRFAHPQASMKRALARIGIGRADVVLHGHSRIATRPQLASEVFRPAEASDAWSALRQDKVPEGMALVEAADGGEEALAIALILREALETPGRTIALATPDRMLARAVQAELERWNVRVADSAGLRMIESPAGILARLALLAARPDAGGTAL
ncbi:MAG TPA: double-strand break repair protein AddB, partial [Beijerinckiaceae bacterium]|nr:double-strand break repair protein AddB [Beijerinckiaceae bacterium]